MDITLREKLKSSAFTSALKQNTAVYAKGLDSKNLLAVHEQRLFVWHSTASCVISTDLSEEESGSVVQSFLPTNPPVFEVDCLLMNCTGTLLLVHGRKGIMVMQIPKTYRNQMSTSEPQDTVFCWSWHIAERFFLCTNEVSLVQAAWYPGSSTGTHVIVLSTDSYLRMYDATDSQTPIQVVPLGQSNSYMSTQFKTSFPQCYGESPVSFDFGPAENITVMTSTRRDEGCLQKEVYPVYILNGNGDIYVVKMTLKKTSSHCATVEGPLPMYPPAEDNYGADACSVLCLHSNPPVLVIAMASGTLYHCILLESNSTDDEKPCVESNFPSKECDVALYVHGSVELPVISAAEDLEDNLSQPIHLYRDVSSNNKYHCSLLCGLYTVALPFIPRLEDCSRRGDTDSLVSLMQQNDSIVEHLLCTKPLASVDPVPVVGLSHVVRKGSVILICLLASGDFDFLPLLSSICSLSPSLLSCETSLPDLNSTHVHKQSFEEHILHRLQRSRCTPVLKMHDSADSSQSSTSIQQWLELVSHTTDQLRKDYIDCLYSVHAEICSRAKVLQEHKMRQIQELDRCLKEKEQLQNRAESLAEKYEDAFAKQQQLLERTEKVLKLLQHRLPILSAAEINMKNDLVSMEEKLKVFQVSLEQIKKKLKCQEEKVRESESANSVERIRNRLQNASLGETQLKHVKEILHQEGQYIADLVQKIILLKKEAGP